MTLMRRCHSTALALAVGVLLGLGLAWAGQAITRSDLFAALASGPPPEAPAFPPRVVSVSTDAEVVNELVLHPLEVMYLDLVDAVGPGTWPGRPGRRFERYDLLRHRSLELVRHEGSLVEALRADARAKGWKEIPELTTDGLTYTATAAFRQNGYTFLVLGYHDGLMPRADNPGLSLELAWEADACIASGEPVPRTDSGLAPCPADGFLQVVVWTDLPAASGAAQPWLDPGMRGLAAGNDVWADPPSWEAFVAQASAG
jgi:hypothetical protein